MSTIPYIVDHCIDAAEPIRCGCEGWLAITRVCDVELDGVVVLYGSALEDGDPWFAPISPGVEDFLMKKTRMFLFNALSGTTWPQKVEQKVYTSGIHVYRGFL